MKKKIIFMTFFVFIIVYVGISYADKVNTSVGIPNQGDLQYIKANFCNEGKIDNKATIKLRPGQTKNICVVFMNTSEDKNIPIKFGFSQAIKGDDEIVRCDGNINTGMIDGLMSYKPRDGVIELVPQEKYVMNIKILAPKDVTGEFYGCFGYQLDETNLPTDSVGMFFLLLRKASIIKISIDGDVYNFGRWDDIKYTYKDYQVIVLKIIAGIIVIALIYYIFVATKGKKPEHHKKK